MYEFINLDNNQTYNFNSLETFNDIIKNEKI